MYHLHRLYGSCKFVVLCYVLGTRCSWPRAWFLNRPKLAFGALRENREQPISLKDTNTQCDFFSVFSQGCSFGIILPATSATIQRRSSYLDVFPNRITHHFCEMYSRWKHNFDGGLPTTKWGKTGRKISENSWPWSMFVLYQKSSSNNRCINEWLQHL